mmetsp:Transcript_8598/g.28170  ORF Transcript_8598/g.28170 Transcript_8598/m.28170 type:complete len:87 (-) Transcript_8598:15-275(-)
MSMENSRKNACSRASSSNDSSSNSFDPLFATRSVSDDNDCDVHTATDRLCAGRRAGPRQNGDASRNSSNNQEKGKARRRQQQGNIA